MFTANTNQQPANSSSSLRTLMARHPMGTFLGMVYTIAWTAFLPMILQGWGLLDLPIDLSEGLAFNAVVSIATIFGIAIPAFLVTAATQGEAGVRDLLNRSLRWRVGVRWYLIALFGFLVTMLLAANVFQGPASLGTLT